MIKSEGCGFDSHTGQSYSILCLCLGPFSMSRVDVQMSFGLSGKLQLPDIIILHLLIFLTRPNSIV